MWHMCAWFTTEDLNGNEQLVTFNIKQTILWRQTFPQIAILFPYIYIYYNIHYYDSHILIHKIISLTFISNYDSHNPIICSAPPRSPRSFSSVRLAPCSSSSAEPTMGTSEVVVFFFAKKIGAKGGWVGQTHGYFPWIILDDCFWNYQWSEN
jgi:hypothetical protein